MCATLTSKRCNEKRHCKNYWGAKYTKVLRNNKNPALTNMTQEDYTFFWILMGFVFLLAIYGNLCLNVTALLRAFQKAKALFRHFLNLTGSLTTPEMAPGIDMTCSRPLIFYSSPA